MSYPPLTPPPPRMEDMDPIEWSAAGEPPPDAAEWTDRRVCKLAVISEPRRGGKSYWRQRAEDAEGRLIDAGYRQAEDRAEIEALRSMLAGRCLSDITHRDEEHRQSVCMLPAEHAPLAHDDCMGCTWTDADHWQPQAVDRVADELQRIADESQHEGWGSPAVRRVVERVARAFEGTR